MQAMDIVAGEIASLVHILAVDVDQELEDSYPAELKRTALRKITRRRPSPRARLRARSLLVKKFVNMTAMQRYDHAKMHAALLPRALRLADLRVMGAMVDLALTSVQVRPSPLFAIGAPPLGSCVSPCSAQGWGRVCVHTAEKGKNKHSLCTQFLSL